MQSSWLTTPQLAGFSTFQLFNFSTFQLFNFSTFQLFNIVEGWGKTDSGSCTMHTYASAGTLLAATRVDSGHSSNAQGTAWSVDDKNRQHPNAWL